MLKMMVYISEKKHLVFSKKKTAQFGLNINYQYAFMSSTGKSLWIVSKMAF